MKLHACYVISPRKAGCRTHSVAKVLVLAASEQEAVAKVAANSNPTERVLYRNEFDNDAILSWSHTSWTREEAATPDAIPGTLQFRDLA